MEKKRRNQILNDKIVSPEMIHMNNYLQIDGLPQFRAIQNPFYARFCHENKV